MSSKISEKRQQGYALLAEALVEEAAASLETVNEDRGAVGRGPKTLGEVVEDFLGCLREGDDEDIVAEIARRARQLVS